MSLSFYFRPGIFDGDGQSAFAHRRKVDDVVSDKGGLVGCYSVFLKNLGEHRRLVLNALVHVVNLKIACPQRDSFRNAFGDDSRLDARRSRQSNPRAVVGMKAFGLDEAGVVRSEAALDGMLRRVLQDALSGPGL